MHRLVKNKNRKYRCAVCLALYYLCVTINLAMKERDIARETRRKLVVDLKGENPYCYLSAPMYTEAADNQTTTLLASYPGSGKRFSWTVIEGLTNYRAGDDHNFSGLYEVSLHLKTSYPHKDGTWSWGDRMDQAIVLMRNPRWALPSYHTMRFELDYSTNWGESYLRIPFVYTMRPAVALWETWRDENFEAELQSYVDFINFWMQGGAGDDHCATDMDCLPKAVIDFDIFYQEHPTTELFKLGKVLNATENVEMISAQAWSCVQGKVFNTTILHNANRNRNGPLPDSKLFTVNQLAQIEAALDGLIATYDPLNTPGSTIHDLLYILEGYKNAVHAEWEFEVNIGL
mmetsp:Transcript_22818/g.33815  ORF Transcript_22818/g.33815 Transcript_22818/m.33815 type:complete len:345 (+) Transcript_22818:56-1090(+)